MNGAANSKDKMKVTAQLCAKLGGDGNIYSVLETIVSMMREQGHAASADAVRDGMLELADHIITNPMSSANPKAYIEQLEQVTLIQYLISVMQPKKHNVHGIDHAAEYDRIR